MFDKLFRSHDLPADRLALGQDADIFKVIYNFLIFIPLFLFTKPRQSGNKIFDKENTDVLKGLCITIIILCHFAIHTLVKSSELVAVEGAGMIGVCGFLLLSGFGLSKSVQAKGLDGFFSKRFKKIFLPLAFFNLVWLILYKYTGFKNFEYNQWPKIILGLTNIDRNYWYIYFLFFWYFVFFLVEKFCAKLKYKNYIYFLIPLVVAGFHIGPFSDLHLINMFSFPAGIFIANNQAQVEGFLSKKLNAGIVFASGLILYISRQFLIFAPNKFGLEFLDLTTILGFILVILLTFWKTHREVILGALVALIFLNSFNPDFVGFASNNIFSLCLVLGFAAFYKIIMKSEVSIMYAFIGSVSFELFLIHGALMYSFDFIIFRLQIVISFGLYLLTMIGLAFATQKLFKLVRIY
ncbi:MAG: acyltransferase family protein [bacterium]